MAMSRRMFSRPLPAEEEDEGSANCGMPHAKIADF